MKKILLFGTPTSTALLSPAEKEHHINNFDHPGELLWVGIERAKAVGYTHYRMLDHDPVTERLARLAAIYGMPPDGPHVGYVVTKEMEWEGESIQGLYASETEAVAAAVALAANPLDFSNYLVTRWCGTEWSVVWSSDRPYLDWG